jgi:hypothetical protein
MSLQALAKSKRNIPDFGIDVNPFLFNSGRKGVLYPVKHMKKWLPRS